jgi:hypothetical protein
MEIFATRVSADPLCGLLTLRTLHSDIPSQSDLCDTKSEEADEMTDPLISA